MELLVLGSGSGVPRRKRAACSLLVEAAGLKILLDLGPGILRRLVEEGLDFQDLDAILLSHLHPDHTADLWPFFFASRWPGFGRDRKVILAASTGLRRLTEGLLQGYGRWVEPREGLIDWRLLEPGRFQELDLAPGLRLRAGPVSHTPDSLAFRLEEGGRSLVYSGDTDWSNDLIRLSQGADLLVLDSALPEGLEVEGHLTPALAGRLAALAGARRLLLTHFYPECEGQDMLDPALREFGGEVILARDGLKLEV